MLQTIPNTMNAVAIDKFGVGVWDPMEREGVCAKRLGARSARIIWENSRFGRINTGRTPQVSRTGHYAR
jgi:hypothetical protein